MGVIKHIFRFSAIKFKPGLFGLNPITLGASSKLVLWYNVK